MQMNLVIEPSGNAKDSLLFQIRQSSAAPNFWAKDFNEAQQIIKENKMDDGTIFLGGQEGILMLEYFMRELRQKSSKIRVIYLCDSMPIDDIRKLVTLGVDQFLVRPFSKDQMAKKMADAEKFRAQVVAEDLLVNGKQNFQHFTEKVSDIYYRIKLSGYLGELNELPQMPTDGTGINLFIDCGGMQGMNSVGIRTWVLWMKALENSKIKRFEFDNVRHFFLNTAAMMPGIFPASCYVNSFYLEYWNDDLMIEKEFKFAHGVDFASDKMNVPRKRTAQVDGKDVAFEIDESSKRYLSFFKGEVRFI